MRRLYLLALAALLAVGAYVPGLTHATPAHAYANCYLSEGDDQVFYDANLYRKVSYWSWDSWRPGPTGHQVDSDIKTFHISHNGNCWRGYYTSVWTEDGTPFYARPWIRTWTCGTAMAQFNNGTDQVWTTNRMAWSHGDWGLRPDGTFYPFINWSVQMWDGSWVTMSFGLYGDNQGGGVCGPQEDQYGTSAGTSTWDHFDYSDPSNPYFYVNGW